MKVHICNFEAVPGLNRQMSYEGFKKTVLKAGRFSAFEASDNQWTARMYTRLSSDPTVKLIKEGFPWTRVEKAAA